jgi:hypothetical protein
MHGYPGISTEAPLPPTNSPSEVTAGDVLKHLSGAAMLSGQARYGKWGLLADAAHAELTDEHVRGGNVISTSSSATIKLTTFTGAVSYNVLHEPQLSIDTLMGLRAVNVKTDGILTSITLMTYHSLKELEQQILS